MSYKHDLDDRQVDLLIALRDNKSMEEMAEQIGKSLGTVQSELGTLLEMGLALRETNERGRTRMRGYKLSAQGEEALRERQISTKPAVRHFS
jgi:predicted transcriptional regulator